MENGLIMDLGLRRIYKPKEHTIRDWQHTLASDGVGNTLICQTLRIIGDRGFSVEHVQMFMSTVELPSKYGKSDPENWLSRNRIHGETLASFSSIVLNLVPMLYLFLETYCSIDDELADLRRMYHLFSRDPVSVEYWA